MQKADAEALVRWGLADDSLMIHPANEKAVRLFLAMGSQWRQVTLQTMQMAAVRSEAVRVGLDYGVIEATARLSGLGKISPHDFMRLRVIEGEALVALSEERGARA